MKTTIDSVRTVNPEKIMEVLNIVKSHQGIERHYIEGNTKFSLCTLKRIISRLIKNKHLFMQIKGSQRIYYTMAFALENNVPKKIDSEDAKNSSHGGSTLIVEESILEQQLMFNRLCMGE